jgi:fatty acid desaturase
MSIYRLYKSPQGEIVRVKMGFSWQAFFVGSLKAIVRRTWLLAVVGLAFYLIFAFYNGAPTATSRTAALLLLLLGFYGVYMLFCGVNGNRWLDDSLRRRGFTLVGEERR